jgi:hypothetical protein
MAEGDSAQLGSFLRLEPLRVIGVVGVIRLAVFGALDLADEVDRITSAWDAGLLEA